MKRPNKLTYAQKVICSNNGLNCDEWAFIEDLGLNLRIINKKTGEIKEVNKRKKRTGK